MDPEEWLRYEIRHGRLRFDGRRTQAQVASWFKGWFLQLYGHGLELFLDDEKLKVLRSEGTGEVILVYIHEDLVGEDFDPEEALP